MPSWRQMDAGDIAGVLHVAAQVHPDLPESAEVFAERLRLFPQGCLALASDRQVCGYAISHPIRQGQLPPLGSLLGNLASDADIYYIHDLAILPQFRGHGFAADGMNRLLELAKQYPATCLISVYGTARFWGRFGFLPERTDAALSAKMRDYGEDATYLTRQTSE